MSINALNIAPYVETGFRFESFEAGEKTKPLIVRLAGILDQLEPQGMDHYHQIWVSARRPTFREFYESNYSDELSYQEADAALIEEARVDYAGSYPTTHVWYRLGVKHFPRESGEEFYAVFFDNTVVFGINDHNSRGVLEGVELLEWAISEAEEFVERVRDGTYRKTILDKIPYQYRTGTIRRKDLWDVYPESKRIFFKPYKDSEIQKFNQYYGTGKAPHPLLPEMTARIYYEACAVVYRSLELQRSVRSYLFKESDSERERYGGEGQTPKEMYYANADGRDDGLKNVPTDDPAAFEEWLREKGPYYEFNGSHPWEILSSFSLSNSMHLIPRKTNADEYLFALSGDSVMRAPDTIIAANALYEAGYPVEVVRLEVIQNRLEGNDDVLVVPTSETDFFGDSMHQPEGKAGLNVAKKVKWNFAEYKLMGEKQ